MTERSSRLAFRLRNILTEEQKAKILKLREMGVSCNDLATRFSIKRSMVDKTLCEMRKRARANASNCSSR